MLFFQTTKEAASFTQEVNNRTQAEALCRENNIPAELCILSDPCDPINAGGYSGMLDFTITAFDSAGNWVSSGSPVVCYYNSTHGKLNGSQYGITDNQANSHFNYNPQYGIDYETHMNDGQEDNEYYNYTEVKITCGSGGSDYRGNATFAVTVLAPRPPMPEDD